MKKLFSDLGTWMVNRIKNLVTFVTVALILFGALAAIMTFEFIIWIIR